MFIRYFVELDLPFDQVEWALIRTPEDWVPGLAEAADVRGEMLMAEVGFGGPGRRIEKQVEIELREPIRFPSRTVVPMSWRATGPTALFPQLEADLEVAALGPGRTQIAVSARYRPPLGLVGKAVDRALLHRVAEATVKDFLDRVACSLPTLVSVA
jgi:hypothetical protein